MKKKHDPPAVRDRVPAMFVGDEPPPPQPVSVEALVAGAPAAMLPEDLRVTTEGTSGRRVPLMVLSLLMMVFGVLAVVKVLDPSVFSFILAALYAWIVVICTRFAWGELRGLIGRREEYHLDEDGIVMSVRTRGNPEPWVMRIRWTEIADYKVSLDDKTLHLRVENTDGATLSLKDSPPRLSTREFVRRFIVEAERHPRAPRLENSMATRFAAFSFPIFGTLGAIAEATLEFSERQEDIVFNIIIVVAAGLYLWHTVDDDDVARSDATSDHLMARLRRWLRRVLGIRPI